MTTMHTAQVAGVCVEDGTVTLTVSPLKVAPAKFAGDVMGWSVVRVGAEALPKEAEALPKGQAGVPVRGTAEADGLRLRPPGLENTPRAGTAR